MLDYKLVKKGYKLEVQPADSAVADTAASSEDKATSKHDETADGSPKSARQGPQVHLPFGP
jgi:hypothetical protein